MDRTRMYTVETVDGIEELDFIHNSISQFTTTYTPVRHVVSEGEILRPDLVSYRFYGTVEYWWVICLANDVEDPLEDFSIGQEIIVPNLLDIYEFVKKYKVR